VTQRPRRYRPKTSTPGLSDAHRARVYGRLGETAPRTARRALFRHFCTPPRIGPGQDAEARLVEKMTPLFARAEQHTIAEGKTRIAAFHWKAPSDAKSRGRVLLVHGWTGRAMVMGLFVEPLRRAGYEVVALDFPAHGASTGQRLNLPIGKRAILAVTKALGPFKAAISHSFGGPVLAVSLDTGPPIPERIHLERIVTIASPNRMHAMIDAFVRRFDLSDDLANGLRAEVTKAAGRDLSEVEVEKFLPASGVPALVIHARDDEDVAFDRAEAIARASPNAYLLALDGLGHKLIVISSTVVRASIGFIDGNVPSGAAQVSSNADRARP
jgi:pimeloyl-ACP methyl ester carboxylesterase